MPLLPNALQIVRANLEEIAKGGKPKTATIGHLSAEQLGTINKYRKKNGLPEISGEVFFVGRHVYDSRVRGDDYSIDDVVDQIASAFSDESQVINSLKMTAIRNPKKRKDRYGNEVRDEAVFECFKHNPKAQLFSVVPRGDLKKPWEIKRAASEAAQTESGSPG